MGRGGVVEAWSRGEPGGLWLVVGLVRLSGGMIWERHVYREGHSRMRVPETGTFLAGIFMFRWELGSALLGCGSSRLASGA